MNVNRKELLAALKMAARVAPKRSPRPTLQNVLLESFGPIEGGPILRIRTTDMETYFQTDIDAPGPGEKFRVLVNAKDARDIVKAQSGDEIVIADIPDSFDAKIGSGMLRGEDPDLFPDLPEAQGELTFRMSGPDLKRMIKEVAFAAAREDSRYSINGIMIERKDHALHLVATDGRRLAMSTLNYSIGVTLPEDEFQVIVPAKPLGYVRMALGTDLVDATVGTNYVQFAWGDTTMVLRQLEANFPDYAAVIPKGASNRLYIDRKELISALSVLKPYSSGDVDAVRFEVGPEGLTLSAKDPEKGEGEASVPVFNASHGISGATALNPTYLLEALKASDLPEVRLEFVDDNTPVLWSMGFKYVQMPISGTA